ncbi:tetratricopeptide repeat protein [Shewanella litorisediminis]|uniref:Tetratricopeptide repeat protein n=1 Tax=Shewanella litorisediminis TaxID=1173586 RepID=A0ABX7G042_9GAMM|nr:tetratricopeptide repeat protein [Shewanella litorisediminis]MCL2918244.1 tetratricopeptide repeat protein [Shewanella litorisediminis]QRH00705.1 tetratricopeptide repeat protein [Shewanella litorisediminis]
MRFILLVFSLLILFLSHFAFARDLKSEEVELRESPQQVFDRVNASLPLPPSPLETRSAFSAYAREQGLSVEELAELLALIARANLQPNVENANKAQDLELIVSSLEKSAATPYEKAMALMLRGRMLGRLELKFEEAAGYFIQALTQDQESQSLASQVLRLNLHEQLGGMYLMINQDVTALVHLQKFRDQAYQLRDDYLIANAEAELGKYYNKKQELTKALQHYSEALRLSDQEHHPFQRAFLQMQLAKVYRDLGQRSEALSHAHDAAETFGQLGSENYLSATLTAIAVTHAGNNEWNKAIDYYLNAVQVDRRSGNYSALARNFHNLGEAYGELGELELSLNYLQQANQMFAERKMKHFLVYNEVLIAKTFCKLSQWQPCREHADIAYDLARQQSLSDVLISALSQKVIAAKALADLAGALEFQEQIIGLQQEETAPQVAANPSTSALTEQKLKLDLHQKNEQLQESHAQLRERTILLAGTLMLVLTLATVVWHYRRSRLDLRAKIKSLKHKLPLDGATAHPGLPALRSAIKSPNTKAVALLRIASLCESDIQLGHKRMVEAALETANAIEKLPGIKAYVIRPGLFGLSFDEPIKAADALLFNLRNQLTHVDGWLQLSFINLPLLPNPELFIADNNHIEVLEMAMAGALSLDADKDLYVTLWALDFTPSAVFSHPLYLHLEKSIGRGLIRVETNGDKDKIAWPQWQTPVPGNDPLIN